MDERLQRLKRQASTGDPQAAEDYLHQIQKLALSGDDYAVNEYRQIIATKENHSLDCEYIRYHLEIYRDMQRFEAAVAKYTAEWPDHCEQCNGWGGATSYYDPSPAGVGLSPGSFADYEPCFTCLEEGKCPRCSGPADLVESPDGDEYYACTVCGWDELKKLPGVPDDVPFHMDCTCWEDEAIEECSHMAAVETDPGCWYCPYCETHLPWGNDEDPY